MSNDDEEFSKRVTAGMKAEMLPDTGNALARLPNSGKEAKAMAKWMGSGKAPNKMRYQCRSCGQDRTLEFEPDEIEGLGGDLTNYDGPCWHCSSMLLVPYDMQFDQDMISAAQLAKASKQQDARIQAEGFFEVAKESMGGIFTGGMQAPPNPAGDPGVAPPAAEEAADLPDPDDVDIKDLKPR